MRSLAALALGLLVVGLGIFGAAVVTPLALPGAFTSDGHTTNAMALVVMFVITTVFTTFGGWITARLSPDHRAGHAIMMAVTGMAVAVLVGAIRWAAAPPWYYAASWAVLPVAAAVGAAAWERSLRRARRTSEARVAVG
jgi:hypothetical protein